MYWLNFLIISLLVVLALLIPYLRPRKLSTIARVELNKSVYQDRVTELQNELELGRIDQSEYEKLELELKKSLLTDVKEEHTDQVSLKSTKLIYGVALVSIPVVSMMLYITLSDWREVVDWHELQTKNHTFEQSDRSDTAWLSELTNQELVLLLRTRLHERPQDTRGWMIFAQTLARLGAVNESVTAIERAIESDPENITLLLNAAQLLVQSKQADKIEYARRLVDSALALQPTHEGAQAVSGFIYRQLGQYQRAIDTWEDLLAQRERRGESSGKGVEMLQQQIDNTKSLLVQEQHLSKVSEEGATTLFSVKLSAGKSIPASIADDAIVFLVVRGDDGSNIPVAVKRKRFGDLPLSLEISDRDAMMPSRTVSQMKSLSFEARLSISGNAKSAPGDWVSDTVTVPVGTDIPVELIIDQPVN